jgi:hypothetical protein
MTAAASLLDLHDAAFLEHIGSATDNLATTPTQHARDRNWTGELEVIAFLG